ncbi:hypothetical protein ACIRST_23410 [Kitasatospora sp. NPDC101447]|uniref:hypothetical protein n=1 Tax=Kitasatospora sp. NPDC101447 TaxID=3364102 RepID=UPI00381F2E8D
MNDRLPRTVALTALAALAVSCTGNGATPTAAQASVPAAAPAATGAAADRQYRPPQEFDGLPSVPDSAFVKLIRSGVAKGDLPATAVGTSYISADRARNITVRVMPQHNTDPAAALDELMAKELPKPELRAGFTEADPGERGGVMRCGSFGADGSTVSALCLWSDGSMLGIYGEYVRGTEQDVDAAARHARDFRRLAEAPS